MPDTTNGGLELFTFAELWSPFLIVALIAIAFIYIYVIKKFQHRHERVPIYKKIMFFAGLLLFYTAQGSPLELVGQHYLFSAHMVNMALSYIAVPPLILGGLPGWFIRPLFRSPVVDKTVRFITNPFIAVLLYTGLYSCYHMPSIFESLVTNDLYFAISKFVMLIVAFNMWWLLVTPLPECDRLSYLQKLGVVFANGALLTPLAALIIFSESVIFDTYANAYRLVVWFQPLDDQQTAGVLMRVIQEIVFASILGMIFFKWARKERQEEESESSVHTETNKLLPEQ